MSFLDRAMQRSAAAQLARIQGRSEYEDESAARDEFEEFQKETERANRNQVLEEEERNKMIELKDESYSEWRKRIEREYWKSTLASSLVVIAMCAVSFTLGMVFMCEWMMP